MKIDERTGELIAIGASVGANCKSCVEYHLGKAREAGVNEEEIADALEVGRMVRRGAASQVDKAIASAGLAETVGAPARRGGCCG